ncbi:hypothetical protein ACP70R_027766 [Stipagrostis hirtigluma subsp. patula]
MATMSKQFVFTLAVMAVLMLVVVNVSASARPLQDGLHKWAGDGEATASVGGGHPITQFLRNLYLQQLPAGPSCTSYDRNNPACRGHPH